MIAKAFSWRKYVKNRNYFKLRFLELVHGKNSRNIYGLIQEDIRGCKYVGN